VVANIYILTYPNARVMNRGDIPGCVVTKKLLEELATEREASDKGKQKRIERAAKQYALARGMGCAGAHIGGHNIPVQMVEEVVQRGEELSGDWERYLGEFDYPQENGFYYFTKDGANGLNGKDTSPRGDRGRFSPSYAFSRLVHTLFYEPKSPLFRPIRGFFKLVESSRLLTRAFGLFERLMKVTLFECMDCGDCALFDVAYLCPMSQCPKSQRNGPCGGSSDGWCEVYPGEKLCVWVRAYRRMMRAGTAQAIADNTVPPVDWALWRTSSWGNYFLGRDHLGKAIEGSRPAAGEREK
jgi:methylenetetrahydrofolate reductase (NADPH)